MSPCLRVLIIEDDPRVRAALLQTLGSNPDLHVLAAGSGQDAVALLARKPADVVLLDIGLPAERDGIDLIRRLAPSTPVVAVSINGAARATALGAGAHSYHEKDGDVDGLLGALRAAAKAGVASPSLGK
jgi:DNA-binding NarL/FixJ family response regulator